jgi:hypothetical protein
VNGFDKAADAIELRAALGKLVWTASPRRCYVKRDQDVERLTITRDGVPVLQSEYVGVSLEDLT